jgi:hypothetical protein
MQGISSHGTVISRKGALDADFVDIGEIGDITMPGLSRNEFETTSHNQDIDSYVLGVLRREPVVFPIFFNKNDATHNAATGLQKAIIENAVDAYRITQPDGQEWIFSGGVQAMTQAAPVDGVQTANVTIRPTGAFLLNGIEVGGL